MAAYFKTEVYTAATVNHVYNTDKTYHYALLTNDDIASFGVPLHEVDWSGYFNSEPTVSGNLELSGEELYGSNFLAFISTAGDKTFYELVPISFGLTVYQCVDNTFQFSMHSALIGILPVIGNISVVNTNDPACHKDVYADATFSAVYDDTTVTLDKALCLIEYDTPFKVVYSYGWLVTEVNTQIFNVECRQDFTSLLLETDVTNIDVVIDEIQQIFDHALATTMLLVSDPADPAAVVAEADLGEPVSLYMSLPPLYRADFDISVRNCWVDGQLVLSEGVPQTALFGAFNETLQGVSTNDFYLFKSLDSMETRDILFSCMIETCLGECISTGESSGRKKRSVITFAGSERTVRMLVPTH